MHGIRGASKLRKRLSKILSVIKVTQGGGKRSMGDEGVGEAGTVETGLLRTEFLAAETKRPRLA